MTDHPSERPARAHSATEQDHDTPVYDHATGGWGSLKGVARIFAEKPSAMALKILGDLNKPKGVMCSSCAWAKPARPATFEFCENGAKATLWELDRKKVGAGNERLFHLFPAMSQRSG